MTSANNNIDTLSVSVTEAYFGMSYWRGDTGHFGFESAWEFFEILRKMFQGGGGVGDRYPAVNIRSRALWSTKFESGVAAT